MSRDEILTIPAEEWGKDHHSLLLYIETRLVDHGGALNEQNLRGHMEGWRKYPTLLVEGHKQYGHNDYDCLADLIAEGYVEADNPSGRVTFRGRGGQVTKLGYKVNALTEKGYDLAHRLRREKAERVAARVVQEAAG